MERIFSDSLLPSGRTILRRARREAHLIFDVSEVDTGHIAIATLNDAEFCKGVGIKTDIIVPLRESLRDLGGYIQEGLSDDHQEVTYSPAVADLFNAAKLLADDPPRVGQLHIFAALCDQRTLGFGSVLYSRFGIGRTTR